MNSPDVTRNKKNQSLFDQVCSFENLCLSFYQCSKGKREKNGHQKFLFAYGERLKSIENELKETHTYNWGGYREFFVHDPKKRLVMAAPFKDRIVHTSINRVIEPILDPTLGQRSFACRIGKGNRSAVLRLYRQLRLMGSHRYCIKLDVKKYFQSVPHEKLYQRLISFLPDDTLNQLLWDLINSHSEYNKVGKGIPIGNLTSQIFANFYLSSLDERACELLSLDFYNDHHETETSYIRYMDDMVILTRDKKSAFAVANELIDFANKELLLTIPSSKKVHLANDPVPFLGFVLSHDFHRVLRRNERKFRKKVKRLRQKKALPSFEAHVIQSYMAWREIPEAIFELEENKNEQS